MNECLTSSSPLLRRAPQPLPLPQGHRHRFLHPHGNKFIARKAQIFPKSGSNPMSDSDLLLLQPQFLSAQISLLSLLLNRDRKAALRRRRNLQIPNQKAQFLPRRRIPKKLRHGMHSHPQCRIPKMLWRADGADHPAHDLAAALPPQAGESKEIRREGGLNGVGEELEELHLRGQAGELVHDRELGAEIGDTPRARIFGEGYNAGVQDLAEGVHLFEAEDEESGGGSAGDGEI